MTRQEEEVQVVEMWVRGGKGEGSLIENDVSGDQRAILGEI
jgi:hypothetical protein